jgi:hypothetical protein
VDWLSFPRSVLMLRFPSDTAIIRTDTAIIRTDTTNPIRTTDTTDPIRTIAIITGLSITGTTGIALITTATTVIIIKQALVDKTVG